MSRKATPKSEHLTCDFMGCTKRKEVGTGSSEQRIYYCSIHDTTLGGGASPSIECLKTKPQLLQYWENRDSLGEKILKSLTRGPMSVGEIAESIGVKKKLVGLKIKHDLEPLGIVKYDDTQRKWLLN